MLEESTDKKYALVHGFKVFPYCLLSARRLTHENKK